MEFLSQFRDDLDAIGPIGKVEIGDDEIGTLCRSKRNDAIAAPTGDVRRLAATFREVRESSDHPR